MGDLFLHLKPDEYLKKLYKTKKLVEKTSFSLQAEGTIWYLFYLHFVFLVNFGSSNIIAMMPQIPIKTG